VLVGVWLRLVNGDQRPSTGSRSTLEATAIIQIPVYFTPSCSYTYRTWRLTTVSANRCVGVRSVIDAGTKKRHELVTSLVHNETANCNTHTHTHTHSELDGGLTRNYMNKFILHIHGSTGPKGWYTALPSWAPARTLARGGKVYLLLPPHHFSVSPFFSSPPLSSPFPLDLSTLPFLFLLRSRSIKYS